MGRELYWKLKDFEFELRQIIEIISALLCLLIN